MYACHLHGTKDAIGVKVSGLSYKGLFMFARQWAVTCVVKKTLVAENLGILRNRETSQISLYDNCDRLAEAVE